MAKRRSTGKVSEPRPGSPPAPEDTTNRSAFLDPFADETLLAYFDEVREWQGYMRFVGLPRLQDNPDIPIDRLYIEPALSSRPLSSDRPAEEWAHDTVTPLDAVEANRRLVLLGDPGSGKSTLVNWLAWRFTRPQEDEWTERLGRLVPLPMILREMRIDTSVTWASLLEELVRQPVAEPIETPETFEAILARGQALILLDGLDEIGGVAVRRALRRAVHEGMERYPHCRWLLTSRVVGYEQVPFDRPEGRNEGSDESEGAEEAEPDAARADWRQVGAFEGSLAATRYVAPFTDDQIERYVRAWYAQREPARERREAQSRDLVRRIRAHRNTNRLARVPSLLAMMALIHRVKAHLPFGRAHLYEEITQAYLETVDEYKGMHEMPYTTAQKKKWLGRLGFEMQQRRSTADEEVGRSEIVVGYDDVLAWMMEAMSESGAGHDPQAAHQFIDYVGRRSGFLLPRGPGPDGKGRYAFMHLSFQEYFAAWYIAEYLTSPLEADELPEGVRPEDLRAYADQEAWRETLILLFEMLADRTGWPMKLAKWIFGSNLKEVGEDTPKARVLLLAEFSIDPQSGFSDGMRDAAIEACCRWAVNRQQSELHGRLFGPANAVLQTLFEAERENEPRIWHALARSVQEVGATRLSLAGAQMSDASGLARLRTLEELSLFGTPISDLRPVGQLQNLKFLHLPANPVSDVSPLGELKNLEHLGLQRTQVRDVGPLGELKNLEHLGLERTQVRDVGPLGELKNLRSLNLSWTQVSDVGPLGELKNLEHLDLTWTPVSDVSPLAHLPKLRIFGP